MPTWPAALPQSLPLESSIQPIDTRIRTTMDAGPPKVRRRFSSRIVNYPSIRMLLTHPQWEALDAFFDTELVGGSNEFTWDEPYPGAGTKTFRFLEPPQVVSGIRGGLNGGMVVSFGLEEVP